MIDTICDGFVPNSELCPPKFSYNLEKSNLLIVPPKKICIFICILQYNWFGKAK